MKKNVRAPYLASFFLLLCSGCNKKIEPSVDDDVFRAFVKCDSTREQDAILSQLRTSVTPIEKRGDLWIYDYKSKILGMNSDQVILGVCGEDGNIDCGWGSLIAFHLTESVSSAKSNLLESYGVDFTIEYRDEESEATLRPLLGKDEKSNQTWLICDPGDL